MTQSHRGTQHRDLVEFIAPRDVGRLFRLLAQALRVLIGSVVGFTVGVLLQRMVSVAFGELVSSAFVLLAALAIAYMIGLFVGRWVRNSVALAWLHSAF